MGRKIQFLIKRIFDLAFSAILLIFSLPFFAAAVAVIKICSPEAPVIYRQQRVGLCGREFTIFKLRTMTEQRDENGVLLPDEQRLRRWGRIIRKTNLDEIPQVFNIFLNQMSLIGPRPLLKKEMRVLSEDEQKIRQSVLPGITGWEAVNESRAHTRRKKALYDLYYVKHWSLWLDIKIFFMTAALIFGFGRPDDSLRAPKIEDEP